MTPPAVRVFTRTIVAAIVVLLASSAVSAAPLSPPLVVTNPDIETTFVMFDFDYDGFASEGTFTAQSTVMSSFSVLDKDGNDPGTQGIASFKLTALLTSAGVLKSGSYEFTDGSTVLLGGSLKQFGFELNGTTANFEFIGGITTNALSGIGFGILPAVGITVNGMTFGTVFDGLNPTPFDVNFSGIATSDAFAATPEPSTLLLVGSGAALLARMKRRRKALDA